MPMWEHTGLETEFTLGSMMAKFWAELVIQLVENGNQHTTVACNAHQNTQAYSSWFKPGNQQHLHVPEYVNTPQNQQFYHISSLDQHPSSCPLTAACMVRPLRAGTCFSVCTQVNLHRCHSETFTWKLSLYLNGFCVLLTFWQKLEQPISLCDVQGRTACCWDLGVTCWKQWMKTTSTSLEYKVYLVSTLS